MKVTIVKPRPEHISEVSRICAAGWRQTVEGKLSEACQDENVTYWYNHDKVRADIESGSYSHVALIDSKVVGTIGGAITKPGRGDVFVLYVDETYRYQGIGRRLLAEFTKEQATEGAREQWVSVEKDNWHGIPFYEARGFVLQNEYVSKTDTGEKHVSLKYRRDIGSLHNEENRVRVAPKK